MQVRNGIIEAIGNTPLLKLKRVSAETGCTILGKAEFMNPGQSVKDRAALFIIEDAVEKGELRPGGVVVEGTAGNTGIGLALVVNAMGYRSVIVIPQTQTQEEKYTLLDSAAPELIEVPVPCLISNPNNYVKLSVASPLQPRQDRKEAARSGPISSTTSPIARRISTAPDRKYWDQTGGKVDGFCQLRRLRPARLPASPWRSRSATRKYPHRPCRSDGGCARQLLPRRAC